MPFFQSDYPWIVTKALVVPLLISGGTVIYTTWSEKDSERLLCTFVQTLLVIFSPQSCVIYPGKGFGFSVGAFLLTLAGGLALKK
jgi:hypothetical protein